MSFYGISKLKPKPKPIETEDLFLEDLKRWDKAFLEWKQKQKEK